MNPILWQLLFSLRNMQPCEMGWCTTMLKYGPYLCTVRYDQWVCMSVLMLCQGRQGQADDPELRPPSAPSCRLHLWWEVKAACSSPLSLSLTSSRFGKGCICVACVLLERHSFHKGGICNTSVCRRKGELVCD